MDVPLAFSVNCPTRLHIGAGCHRQIGDVLAGIAPVGAVLLVRGGSGVASAPVQSLIRGFCDQTGRDLRVCSVSGEPSLAGVNDAARDLIGQDIAAIVACGGGSVIDMAKALGTCLVQAAPLGDDFGAVPPVVLAGPWDIPLIALPTTAGTGAEVTANAVLDVGGQKLSLRGRGLTPRVALVDPDLMRMAPPAVVLQSGLDAIVQTIEAYTSCRATPFTDALTGANITKGLRALRAVIEGGSDAAWAELAWVSTSSGLALSNGGLGAVHGLAAILGGRYPAPHGALCGRLLTPVLRRNLSLARAGSRTHAKIDHCVASVGEVFARKRGLDDLSGFESWIADHNLPRLAQYGVKPADFDDLARAAVPASSSQKNAVPYQAEDFEWVLEAAI
jgi:alcohol dehydrogenase class IV